MDVLYKGQVLLLVIHSHVLYTVRYEVIIARRNSNEFLNVLSVSREQKANEYITILSTLA